MPIPGRPIARFRKVADRLIAGRGDTVNPKLSAVADPRIDQEFQPDPLPTPQLSALRDQQEAAGPVQPTQLTPAAPVRPQEEKKRGFLGIRGRIRDFSAAAKTEEGRSAIFGLAGAISSASEGNAAIAAFAKSQRDEITGRQVRREQLGKEERDLQFREEQAANLNKFREKTLTQQDEIIELKREAQEAGITDASRRTDIAQGGLDLAEQKHVDAKGQLSISNALQLSELVQGDRRVAIAEGQLANATDLQALREREADEPTVHASSQGLFVHHGKGKLDLVPGSAPVNNTFPKYVGIDFPDGGKGYVSPGTNPNEFVANRFDGPAGQPGQGEPLSPIQIRTSQQVGDAGVMLPIAQAVIQYANKHPELFEPGSKDALFLNDLIEASNKPGVLDESRKSILAVQGMAILLSSGDPDTVTQAVNLRDRGLRIGTAASQGDFEEVTRLSGLGLDDPNDPTPEQTSTSTDDNFVDGIAVTRGPDGKIKF